MCYDDDRFTFDPLVEELRIPGGVQISTPKKNSLEKFCPAGGKPYSCNIATVDLIGVEVDPGYHHVASANKTCISSTIGFDIEELTSWGRDVDLCIVPRQGSY
jgi:hypothetical protein